jgi:small-conductance mechanosensitive channel/flagellar motor protein MotB
MIKTLFFLIFYFFSFIALGETQPALVEQKNTQAKETSIELSDIPKKIAEIQQELEKIQKDSQEKKEITEIHQSLNPYIDSIEKLLNTKEYKDLNLLTIKTIQKKSTELYTYVFELEKWSKQLDENINTYEDEEKRLESILSNLQTTQQEAKNNKAPKIILTQIKETIAKTQKLKKKIKDYFNLLLTDLNIITNNSLKIKKTMELLKETEIVIANDIFKQNKLPLVEVIKTHDIKPEIYFVTIAKNMQDNIDELIMYINIHQDKHIRWFTYIFFITSFILYFNYLYRKKRLFIRKESLQKKDFFFIKKIFSTWFILIAFLNVLIFPDIPEVVTDIHVLIILIPVFQIIKTVIDKDKIKYFYTFFILYIIFLLHKNAMNLDIENRIVSVLLSLSSILALLYHLKGIIKEGQTNQIFFKLFYKLPYLLIFILFYSAIANLTGYVLLSNRILESVFITIYSSLIFYAIYVILKGYIIVLLRRHMASATNLVEEFSIKAEKNTVMVVKIIMILWWLKVTFKTIGIYPLLLKAKNDMMNFSWKIASTTISIQSIVDFIIIILGTWFLSRFLGTLLEVEIFSRYKFPRGIPTAIKTVLNYIIIISGTLIALSTLGITQEQFTLVFGALGVGIGFGLRNIIANFISGIIMVFERPIQIGDTIQINTMVGQVQNIGARSSTIKTFDGSEVIIPNADFISKEIINWTLSDERRRKVLEFKVDFENDIEQVLHIMEDVALSNSNVLKDPKPLATFNGFGEYYLEFKLYFWLSENMMIAQSNIAIEIYKKLKESGVSMPRPKQDILLNSKEESS